MAVIVSLVSSMPEPIKIVSFLVLAQLITSESVLSVNLLPVKCWTMKLDEALRVTSKLHSGTFKNTRSDPEWSAAKPLSIGAPW